MNLELRPALLGLLLSSSITCLTLAVYGLPWNIYWWSLILVILAISFFVPLYVGMPGKNRRVVSSAAYIAIIICSLAAGTIVYNRYSVQPQPVFTLDFQFPTRDKSQSKLWFSQGAWWAWLPHGNSSTLWRRNPEGEWSRAEDVGGAFEKLAGLADVWPERDYVAAVVFSSHKITFAKLDYSVSSQGYILHDSIHAWFYKDDPTINNATIARDEAGIWWISYTQGKTVWVISSKDKLGGAWHEPMVLANEISRVDKSVIFPVKGGTGVMWGTQTSDGKMESLRFIMHEMANPYDHWEDLEILHSGDNVGEDHFNTAQAANSEVFISTMDDNNIVGQPLLVLWIRTESGSWTKIPYGTLRKSSKPTRAIVLFRENKDQYFVVHTRLNLESDRSHDIVYRCGSQKQRLLSADERPFLVRPGFNITDPTSTKQYLPENEDWIVLASDKKGRVYEGRLSECAD